MNVTHLKYAVEVWKTGSISKAAENLFVGQPNVSKAIKELEEEFGITIFKRTPKGVIPTEKGAEFLGNAKRIVAEINEFEELYTTPDKSKQIFKIAVPRCYHAVAALANFTEMLDPEMDLEICFRETSAVDAISCLLTENYGLAIIRVSDEHKSHIMQILREKELKCECLSEFRYRAVMAKCHALAEKSTLTREDFADFTEIVYGDDTVPSSGGKRIRIFDRGSKYELLSAIPNSFMWDSPVGAEILDRYGLTERDVADADSGKYLLIYPKFYRLTKLDKMYMDEFKRAMGI